MESMISAATQINHFLVLGGVAALAVILAKLFIRNEAGTVKFAGVEIPLNHAWVAMALLTLAHAYYSWLMLVGVARILYCQDPTLSLAAWMKLTEDADKLRVMYQMSERHPMGWLPVSNPWKLDWNDPLLIMHVLLVVGVFFATIRWFRTTSWPLRILTTVAGMLLVTANWYVGSQWALLASDLARTGRHARREAVPIERFVTSHVNIRCAAAQGEHL